MRVSWSWMILLSLSASGCLLEPGADRGDAVDPSDAASMDAPDDGAQRADAPDDAAAGPDDGADPALPDASPPAGARVVTPAGQATLQTDFSLTLSGALVERLDGVALVDNVGELLIDGVAAQALVYERQAWDGFGLTLYQALIIEETRWHAAWFYCEGERLTGVYIEGSDGSAMRWIPATDGRCEAELGLTSRVVDVPAVDMPAPAVASSYDVEGDALTMRAGEPGWVQLDGVDYAVYGFEEVDCTVDCGQTPGWYELHSVLWSAETARACFAIFYFSLADQAQVQLAYALCLPTLDDPAQDRVLSAPWTRR